MALILSQQSVQLTILASPARVDIDLASPEVTIRTQSVGIVAAITGSRVELISGGPPGPQGPQGPAGTPGGARLEFVQSTPSGSWMITHNFGYVPVITVYDVDGNVISAEMSADSTTANISHNTPLAGKAVLV